MLGQDSRKYNNAAISCFKASAGDFTDKVCNCCNQGCLAQSSSYHEIPTMITALALPKLESALAGPIHLNKISSAIEVSAVTPMGYLFHANMTIIYRKIAMQKTICNVIG